MLAAERHDKILRLIRERGSVEVNELGGLLNVSIVTVRRDLDKLASEGLIVRTHGGAIRNDLSRTTPEPPYDEKKKLYVEEKRRIGLAAAEMVEDGETVILDSGSTTFEMVRPLQSKRDLTIVTNDLIIAKELSSHHSLSVVMVGGLVRSGIFSSWGTYAEEMLRNLNADKTFLAADAVDLKRGVLNTTPAEVPVKRLMIEAGRKVILLVDHSKFFKTALAKVCGLEEISHLITDSDLPEEVGQLLKIQGVALTLV